MTRKHRLPAAAFALLAAGLVTACGAPAEQVQPAGDVGSLPVELKSETKYKGPSNHTRHVVGHVQVDVDGRIVDCVTYDVDRGGGIDCDWASVPLAEPAP